MNDSEGSTAVTADEPTRPTSSAVSAPGPQPTSITFCPLETPAKSANSGASGTEYLPMNLSYASAATAKLTGESTLRSKSMHVLLAALALGIFLALQPGAVARGGVEELTLEQQVGQLIVLSFAGTTPPEYVREALRERRAAGVILFGGNIMSRDQLRDLTRVLRRQGGRPIVAVDQEGGEIRRVPWAPPVASAPEQVAAGSVSRRGRGGRAGAALRRHHGQPCAGGRRP